MSGSAINANPTHFLKEGDTSKPLDRGLRDESGNPVDLTTATQVLFTMFRRYSRSLVSPGGVKKIDAQVAVVLAGNPPVDVRYTFVTADVNEAGWYDGEFEVFFPGGVSQTFPDEGAIPIRIAPDGGV